MSSHLSPNASLKDLELGGGVAANQNISGIELNSIVLFNLYTYIAGAFFLIAGKEPNLMPVPSPQQIQYLNAFEGQELTIQKQPNTNVKDNNNIISPS